MTDTSKNHHLGIEHASITTDATPRSTAYSDIYFSADGCLAESRHVFVGGNNLRRRLASWRHTRPFVIGETGFGTGRNALIAWQTFKQVALPTARLHIVSFERHPARAADLEQVWANYPELATYARRLIRLWPPALRSTHRIRLDSRVTLDLILDDIDNGLASFDGRVDAWFLDGFAPSRNPAMWSQAVFDKLAAASRPGATFATYSCARMVRDHATAAGFAVRKRSGAGRKREMLCGRLDTAQTKPSWSLSRPDRPWFEPPHATISGSIAIIGAGIAGATLVEALARRGYRCDIYDPYGGPGGASGSPQAALHVRLSVDGDIRTRFYLAALTYTQRWLADFDPARELWNDCGLLQLACDDNRADQQRRCINQLQLPATVVKHVDAKAANELAGIALADGVRGGLFYPGAGWVRPYALCRRLLEASSGNIHAASVRRLQRDGDYWRLSCDDGRTAKYEHVVLACAHHAAKLWPDLPPLQTVRGQTSTFASAAATPDPRCVVCGNGHVSPSCDGRLHVGASFVPDTDDATPRTSEDNANISMLAEFAPKLADQIGAPVESRVAFRCSGHNRLPYVGPVPNNETWRQDYAVLALDARRVPNVAGCVQSGLWASLAHGANGMVSAPLAAEMLASQLCGEPAPLPMDVVDALLPGRWLIREVIRGR